MSDLVKAIISKRDPQGYYVISLRRTQATDNVLLKVRDAEIEYYGDTVIVRTKSRDEAKRIVRLAIKCGILAVT